MKFNFHTKLLAVLKYSGSKLTLFDENTKLLRFVVRIRMSNTE